MLRNQIKIGIMLSYISQGIQILTALIYTPIMLKLLGQEQYGLYQLIYSIVSYLGLLNLGFSSSYIKYYTIYKLKKTDLEIKKLNGMFFLIFFTVSCISLLCGILLLNNINLLLKTINDNYFNTACILMKIMIFNIFITFLKMVFDCNIIANEKFIFQNILNPFLGFILLLNGKGSVGLVLVTTVLTVISFLVSVYYCIYFLNMKFVFKKFDIKLFSKIFNFTIFIFINQIIDQINWNVDRMIIGKIQGISAVAVYSVAAQINAIYVQFSVNISSVYIPKVNNLINENKDDHKINELFIKVGRFQFCVLMFILTNYLLFGYNFMILWAGNKYIDSYYIGIILLVSITIPLCQNLGIAIQQAKDLHRMRSLVYLFIAIINIFISIPLVRSYSGIGAALGTAISLLVGNVIFMNFYYNFKIGLDMQRFYKQISEFIFPLLLSLLVGWFLKNYININKWSLLFCAIILNSIFYIFFMYLFGINKEEKYTIKRMLKFNSNSYF